MSKWVLTVCMKVLWNAAFNGAVVPMRMASDELSLYYMQEYKKVQVYHQLLLKEVVGKMVKSLVKEKQVSNDISVNYAVRWGKSREDTRFRIILIYRENVVLASIEGNRKCSLDISTLQFYSDNTSKRRLYLSSSGDTWSLTVNNITQIVKSIKAA